MSFQYRLFLKQWLPPCGQTCNFLPDLKNQPKELFGCTPVIFNNQFANALYHQKSISTSSSDFISVSKKHNIQKKSISSNLRRQALEMRHCSFHSVLFIRKHYRNVSIQPLAADLFDRKLLKNKRQKFCSMHRKATEHYLKQNGEKIQAATKTVIQNSFNSIRMFLFVCFSLNTCTYFY